MANATAGEACAARPETMAPPNVLKYVDGLYEEYPGEVLRAACREEIEAQDQIGSLVYGEVGFMALVWILKAAKSHCTRRGDVAFYDLGSGSGRMVHYTALLHPSLRRCVGIEIIGALHDVAISVAAKHLQMLEILPRPHSEQSIEFIHGDILEIDWSDAGIVLVNSTCFTPELMAALEARAANILQNGSVIVTFTSPFQGDCWELVSKSRRQMSWGPADIYIHQRTAQPAPGQQG
mmetsp:Transcript_32613/g.83326  ORF Transcript_32613/g.83326 Transcript_32613/m.83326 type:complete len:236 (+) Transcript_32613:243-950(+)